MIEVKVELTDNKGNRVITFECVRASSFTEAARIAFEEYCIDILGMQANIILPNTGEQINENL